MYLTQEKYLDFLILCSLETNLSAVSKGYYPFLTFVVIDIPKPFASIFAIPPSKKNRKDQPLFQPK